MSPPLDRPQETERKVDLAEEAREVKRYQEFGHAAVEDLGVVGQFDVVSVVYLLHYAPTREHLAEMCRTIAANLRPGGRLVAVQARQPQRQVRHQDGRIPETADQIQVAAHRHGQQRHQRHQRRLEGPVQIGVTDAQNPHSCADNSEGQQCADVDQLKERIKGKDGGKRGHRDAGENAGDRIEVRGDALVGGVGVEERLGQQVVAEMGDVHEAGVGEVSWRRIPPMVTSTNSDSTRVY